MDSDTQLQMAIEKIELMEAMAFSLIEQGCQARALLGRLLSPAPSGGRKKKSVLSAEQTAKLKLSVAKYSKRNIKRA